MAMCGTCGIPGGNSEMAFLAQAILKLLQTCSDGNSRLLCGCTFCTDPNNGLLLLLMLLLVLCLLLHPVVLLVMCARFCKLYRLKLSFAVARPQSRSAAAAWQQSSIRITSRIFAYLWQQSLTQPQSRSVAAHRPQSRSSSVEGVIMADSKEAATVTQGIITAGMAHRVKYRDLTVMGAGARKLCAIQSLGDPSKNRGGVHPSGRICKGLGADVVDGGFSKTECNYAGVAAAERPRHTQPSDYVDMRTFNITSTVADERIATSLSEQGADVRHGSLSHSHLMVEQPDSKNTIFCDAGGRLSRTAVADHANGRPMLEVVADGLMMEILSWHTEVEEPTAAHTISQALNKGHAHRSPYD